MMKVATLGGRRIEMSCEPDQKVVDAVQLMIDFVNGDTPENLGEMIYAVLLANHRTLQQSFIGGLKHAIEQYSKIPHYCVDLRNESAMTWAKQVAALCDSPAQMLPGRLPLV